MRRVIVIGCFGAGKSLFSAELSRLAGLPLHHLDCLFRRPGMPDPDRQEWRQIQEKLVAGPEWVIEGNYGATLDLRLRRADAVIFLDIGTASCLCGVLARIIRSRTGLGRPPHVVPGCNERLDWRFLKSVLLFNRRHRKGILSGLQRYPNIRMIHLRSRREARDFLKTLRESRET